MDLALFIAHTGFINIRNARPKSDVGIIPGLSLDTVWRLVDQNLLGENAIWYIVEEFRFILYIRDSISKSVFDILSDDESLGPFQTTFRPEPVAISLDTFISRNMPISSMQIYRALCIMFPMFMEQHGLSRNTIVNRRSKLRRDLE